MTWGKSSVDGSVGSHFLLGKSLGLCEKEGQREERTTVQKIDGL